MFVMSEAVSEYITKKSIEEATITAHTRVYELHLCMLQVLESNSNELDLSAFSHSSVMTLLAFLYSATAPISLGDEERQELVTQAEM